MDADLTHFAALVARIIGYGMLSVKGWHIGYWVILGAELLILFAVIVAVRRERKK